MHASHACFANSHQFCSDDFPMILVGNKGDLASDRQITEAERTAIGKELKITTIETSAKTRTNVDTCFYDLVRAIRYVGRVTDESFSKQLP